MELHQEHYLAKNDEAYYLAISDEVCDFNYGGGG